MRHWQYYACSAQAKTHNCTQRGAKVYEMKKTYSGMSLTDRDSMYSKNNAIRQDREQYVQPKVITEFDKNKRPTTNMKRNTAVNSKIIWNDLSQWCLIDLIRFRKIWRRPFTSLLELLLLLTNREFPHGLWEQEQRRKLWHKYWLCRLDILFHSITVAAIWILPMCIREIKWQWQELWKRRRKGKSFQQTRPIYVGGKKRSSTI